MKKTELSWLLIIYLLLLGSVFFGSLAIKGRFSEGWLDQMVSSKGRAKQLTSDPCAYAISGEPNAAGRYVKLVVTCKDGRQSWNTFDARAINTETLEAILLEFQRINGIAAETKNYRCDMDSAPIELTSKIQIPSTINCRYE